jgi:hypothetical protein
MESPNSTKSSKTSSKDGLKEDPNNTKPSRTSSKDGLMTLLNELKSLRHIEDPYVFFDRVRSRTKIMIASEPATKRQWQLAREHNKDIKSRERKNALELQKLRKKLNLDQILLSLKARRTKGLMGLLEEFDDDQWINEALDWLVTKKGKKQLKAIEERLFDEIMLRDLIRPKSYKIGQHPFIALALFDRLCDDFQSIDFIEDRPISPRSHPVVLDVVTELQVKLKKVIEYLIDEIPNVKTWGEYAVQAFEWKAEARDAASKLWGEDPMLSRAEVSRTIYEKLRKAGVNVETDTIDRAIADVDPRSPSDKNLARGGRRANLDKRGK